MFTGYFDATVDFMWGIRFNNERDWFLAHKDEYLKHLYQPTADLAREVYDAFQEKYADLGLELHISRIYRDARRLHGRGPYKDHLWFSIRRPGKWEERPCFYFEITPEGYGYGMGFYSASAQTMENYRKALDANPRPFAQLAEDLARHSEYQIHGQEYKRKKGEPGGVLDDWYNRKWIDISCQRPMDETAYSTALKDELLRAFDYLMPFFKYFQDFCDREKANS